MQYIVTAEDLVDREPLSNVQWLAVAWLKIKDTSQLLNRVELATGMKAMVLMNLAMGANLANGLHGTITDIILDP